MEERRRCALLIVSCVLLVCQAVSTQGVPAFEVASVTENRSGGAMTRLSPGLQPRFPGGAPNPVPGQISISNATLQSIVALAYGLDPAVTRHTLKGGSDRILQTRFNIVAKPPEGAPSNHTLLMLRSLLSERFKLRTHTEAQQGPVYALKVVTEGRLGPELRPSQEDCTSPSMPDNALERARLGPKDADGQPLCGNPYGQVLSKDTTRTAVSIGYVSPLDLMVRYIQPFVDLLIVDETSLHGSFRWKVSFSPAASLDPGADPTGTTVVIALREQLGLKLERQSRPIQVMVIDSVEMPTPN